MKAVQLAPRNKVNWPGWHVLGAHRAFAGMAGLAVIVVVAVIAASAALAPGRPTVSTAPGPQAPMFAAFQANAVGPDAMSLTALRKVFDPTELAVIAAARTNTATLGASRQDERALDRQLKAQMTVAASPVTLDAAALFAAKADERSLDRHQRAVRSGAGTDTPVPMRFSGKPLPF
ncbi:MAG: hypothetical protein ACYDAN_08525 [Candidatus Limnocylindrales bacterium]